MTEPIAIRRPDDRRLHVRDEATMRAALPPAARCFGRAILTPNLLPLVRTSADAAACRRRAPAALPPGADFQPLMTCYLTYETDPGDVDCSKIERALIYRGGETVPWRVVAS